MRQRSRSGPRSSLLLGALAILGMATLVGAVEDLDFEVERIDGAGWSAEHVVVTLDLSAGRTSASANVSRLLLESPKQSLSNVRIRCPSVDITPKTISCEHAQLLATLPSLGAQTLTGRMAYGRETGELEGRLAGLRVGAGRIAVEGVLRESDWRARAQLDQVELKTLLQFAADMKVPTPGLSGTGVITATISVSGSAASVRQANLVAALTDVTVSNEEGSLATERLSMDLRADVTGTEGDWQFQADLKSNAGQAYAQPIFLDFGAHAIAANARGVWKRDGTVDVEHFSLDHRDVAQGEGSASIRLDADQPLQALQLKLGTLQFPGAYEAYLQPLLLDTGFRSMTTSGAISGEIAVADGLPQNVHLRFDDVSLDDGQRAFVLHQLSGDWYWADARASVTDEDDDDAVEISTARDSQLSWSGGTLLNLELGASRLSFRTQERQVRLLEPVRIPIFDGALELESFRIRNAGLPTVAFIVDATIQPISVSPLCNAFGWPEFGGRIGGKISKLRLREKVATLGTTLQAQVFDGSVNISDLKLEQPFSDWPRFYANIGLENLDLGLVTSAFSFGGITGRLSGEIKGLELFNWSPVAFDARLYTPPDDRSRHRISQRAVENIGSIGGGGAGVTAALSGGVLRFFEDFNYDRLGISCRLDNDVCLMNGVAPAPNGGYYLVKGSGLPRIDVIGNSRRVDWPRLVKQLIAVTQSEGPIVN